MKKRLTRMREKINTVLYGRLYMNASVLCGGIPAVYNGDVSY